MSPPVMTNAASTYRLLVYFPAECAVERIPVAARRTDKNTRIKAAIALLSRTTHERGKSRPYRPSLRNVDSSDTCTWVKKLTLGRVAASSELRFARGDNSRSTAKH